MSRESEIAECLRRVARAKSQITWSRVPAVVWKDLTIVESKLRNLLPDTGEWCPIHGTKLVEMPPTLEISATTGERIHRPREKAYCHHCGADR